jgi:dephospho-CoA kinase
MALSTASEPSKDSRGQDCITIGLTGGMGAGKSTVSKVLKTLGHVVYDSDRAAKGLYDSDMALRQAVMDRFGEAVFTSKGDIDRAALAKLAFNSPEATRDLNEMVHPAVRQDFEKWRKMQVSLGHRGVFKEAAILFESGAFKQCDQVWLVSAPLEIRKSRIMSRMGMTIEDMERRMALQWPEERKRRLADQVIVNDGEVALVPQLLSLTTNGAG